MAIATLSGVAIRPGISRNGRLYDPALLERSVARAQARIADGSEPMVMLTHHDAGDDSEKITAVLREWRIADTADVTAAAARDDDVQLGDVLYEADMLDTPPARTILELTDPADGSIPALRNVSIRGFALGPIRKKTVDGQLVDVFEDLDLEGLDWTKTPGVAGAANHTVTRTTTPVAAESSTGRLRNLIYESAPEAHVVSTAVSEGAPAASVTPTSPPAAASPAPTPPPAPVQEKYADHGYLGAPALPVTTAGPARASWRALRVAETADRYTAPQLKRVKERVAKALREHGVEIVNPEGWLLERAAPTREAYDMWGDWVPDGQEGSFTARIDNGVVSVTITSWRVDPHDLTRIARAAMTGAASAMDGLDPDMDGDIDGPTAERARPAAPPVTETAPDPAAQAAAAEPAAVPPAAAAVSQPSPDTAPAEPDDTSTSQEGEPGMAEPTTPSAAPATGITMTDEQFTRWLATQTPPAAAPAAAAAPVQVTVGAPAETAAPAAPVVAETDDQRIARIVAEKVAALRPPPVVETEEQKVARLVAEHVGTVPPPAVIETEEQRIGRIVQEQVRGQVQTLAESGQLGARKGIVPGATTAAVTEAVATPGGGDPVLVAAGLPDKPMDKYTPEEQKLLRAKVGQEFLETPPQALA